MDVYGHPPIEPINSAMMGGILRSCPYQKLDPDVGMVQTTEVRYGSDLAFSRNWPSQRRIFVQRQMTAGTIVILGVGAEYVARLCHINFVAETLGGKDL